jgi:hypothetical protein
MGDNMNNMNNMNNNINNINIGYQPNYDNNFMYGINNANYHYYNNNINVTLQNCNTPEGLKEKSQNAISNSSGQVNTVGVTKKAQKKMMKEV